MPIVTVLEDESTPATINDPALSARLQKIFVEKLGADNVVERQAIMGSEDFGIFGLDHKIPAVIFWLGAYDPAKVAESEQTTAWRSLRRTPRSSRHHPSRPCAQASPQ